MTESTPKRLNQPKTPMTPEELERVTAYARTRHKADFRGATPGEVEEAQRLANSAFANNEDTSTVIGLYEDISRAMVALDRIRNTSVAVPFELPKDIVDRCEDVRNTILSIQPDLEGIRRDGKVLKMAIHIHVSAWVVIRR